MYSFQEPHEQYEKAIRYHTPQVSRCPICYRRRAEKQLQRNEEAEPKQKQYPDVDVSGGENKESCCKEQYGMGTWNVRPMKQGKLEVANRRQQE